MINTYNNLLLEKINFNQGELDSIIINDLIKTFEPDRTRMIGLWDRYKGQVPIKNKKMPDYYKQNNKLASDFRGYITQQGLGYTLGSPIVYNFDSNPYQSKDIIEIRKTIDSFNKINDVELLDLTACELSSVCGYAARLLYIDVNGILRAMNLNPWETIFVYDPTIDKMQYAIIYYQVDYYDTQKKKYEKRWKVELYDDKEVTFYFEYDKDKFQLDPDEKKNPMQHMFNHVPVVKINNNKLELGDFEKVESLIDNYDYVFSQAADNLGEFALAYLNIKGGTMNDEDIIRAKASGIFQSQDGVEIDFITKNLPTEFTFKQLETLKQQIYHLSATIDPSDPAYSGNAESGISRKIKYVQVDNKIVVKIYFFIQSLYKQYELLTDIWAVKKIPLNYIDMIFTFNKNIPNDLVYYGTAGQALTGLVSHETILSQFPFIADPKEELIRVKTEQELYGTSINLDEILEPTGSL